MRNYEKLKCNVCFGRFGSKDVIEVKDHLLQQGDRKFYVCRECFKTYSKPEKVDVSKFVKAKERKKKKKIRKTQTMW